MITFTYKKQSFLISTPSSKDMFEVPSFFHCGESDLHSFTEERLEEQIAFNHELNHYLQDMSVSACIVEGEFRDIIANLITEVCQYPNIKAPFENTENRAHNISIINLEPKEIENINLLYTAIDIYNSIYLSSYEIDTPVGLMTLSITDLLESYAFHKSYAEMFFKAESKESIEKIKNIIKKNRVFPFKWDDDRNDVIIDRLGLKANKVYQLVPLLLLYSFQSYASIKEIIKYCNDSMPENFSNSSAWVFYSYMMRTLDSALTMPSAGAIIADFQNGGDLSRFSPVHRFHEMLMRLMNNPVDMPEYSSEQAYTVTYNNWICQLCGIPSISDCYLSLYDSLMKRAEQYHEAITNNQLNTLVYKFNHYDYFLRYQMPFEVIQAVFLPITILTSDNLTFYSIVSNQVISHFGMSSFYSQYFYPTEITNGPIDLDKPSEIIKFKHYNQNMPYMEAYRAVLNNNTATYREIACRMMSHCVSSSFLRDGYFSCPFKGNGCPHSSEHCTKIMRFLDVIGNCNKNIKHVNGKIMSVPNGEGDTYDCMLLDYIITYNYKTKVIW